MECPMGDLSILPYFPMYICMYACSYEYIYHLPMSIWTHGYLVYTLCYNPILPYFLLLKLLRFGHYDLFQLATMFPYPFDICSLLKSFFFSFFLLSGSIKCSRFFLEIFCPYLNLSIIKIRISGVQNHMALFQILS